MSQPGQSESVGVLKLTLHSQLVGYLAGFQGGKNVLTFADEYKANGQRPTFSLTTHPAFPRADKLLAQSWVTNQRLHPTLSNLLPEGALRELIAQSLKVHPDNEFEILSYLSEDLPGAIVATAMNPDDIPEHLLNDNGRLGKAIKLDTSASSHKFSLAGVQMKFSMKERDGRFNFTEKKGELGDWIIKTPSTNHKDVPLNEYTAMTLAAIAGVEVPEIKLIEVTKLNNLPQIKLPDEQYAYGIKRFDRAPNSRIHMEDFAQVLVKYPHEKYGSANYEQIGRVLYQYSGDGLADAQQFARRLLVNILLANGDAHLKNWSLSYSDQVTARLSMSYDIVTTSVYIENEQEFALKLGNNKEWYKVTYAHFEAWATKADVPWRAIKPHLEDVMDKARVQWPQALIELPMHHEHKEKLKLHWQRLHDDFRIIK
tara:strand:- start:363 stop:1643 length:1281 start_codon:yes stop_codon:yes gene_type:complete